MLLKWVSKPGIQAKSGHTRTRTHRDTKTLQPLPSLSRVKVKLGSRRSPANLPPDQNSKQCSGAVLLSVLTVHWPQRFAHTTQQWTQPSGFVSVWNFKVVPMADLIFILNTHNPQCVQLQSQKEPRLAIWCASAATNPPKICFLLREKARSEETGDVQYTTSHFASCLLSSVLTSATELMQI